MSEEQPIFWTVEDTAKFLLRKPSTIYKWTSLGLIPHIKLSEGSLLFEPKDVIEWVKTRKVSVGSKRKRKVEIS